jgi:hypothetical protein
VTEPSDGAPQPHQPPQDWTPVEQGLWEAYRLGEWYDLRTGIPERDDPAADRFWGPDRTVRAESIARLLLDGPPAVSGRVACVKLSGAQISGELQLSGGNVVPYVELRDCRFEQVVMLSECQFTTVRMVHCAIPRLEAARLHTTGDLHLPQCTVEGGIRLTDAHIGTDLLLNQLTVRRDRHGRAIAADGLNVAQDVEAELIEATGEISLRSARIGGRLSLRGSVLHNPYGRYALNAARVQVEHTLYLSAGYLGSGQSSGTPPNGVRTRHFTCEGGLRLDDGRFGNAVIIHQARFRLTGSQQLSLRRVQTPELRLTLDEPPTGTISLAGARVGNLTDAQTCWPETAGVDLTGFTYGSLSPEGPFPLRERIAWLAAATPEYSPEPYEHLAAALRVSGEDSDAREVLLAKQRRRRETLPLAGKLWGYLQDVTVGYGYRAGRAALWMAVLWAIGATFFRAHPPPPLKAGEAPHWSAALYALDLLLPVIDLGQDSAWRPAGGEQWAAAVLVVLGWVLATTVAAGASRLLRRG